MLSLKADDFGEMASQHPAPGEPQAASKEPTAIAAVLADNTGQPTGPEATDSTAERDQGSGEQPESPKTQTAADLPPGSGKEQGDDKEDLSQEETESSDGGLHSSKSGGAAGGGYLQTSRGFISRAPTKTVAGILYVNDEYFADAVRQAMDFHIIVSTSEILPMDRLAAEGPSNKETSKPEGEDPDACSYGPDDTSDYTDDSESGAAAMESFLPIRLRIMNLPLLSELGIIARFKGVRHVYENHTAPFRSIIPHEKEIRSRLQDVEAEFATAQQKDPENAAIMGRFPCLYVDTMLPVRSESRTPSVGHRGYAESQIPYLRAAVEGLRALVYLLDHDLCDLAKTYWQLQKGPVANLRLPYLYLGKY